MCGIVAAQTHAPALDYLLPALHRLEYRGYDSAGVAVHTEDGDVVRLRATGRIAALERLVAERSGAGLDGVALDGVAIGHTRWATHGAVTQENAHPHADCIGDVHVVHNGIIENAQQLRARLVSAGHRFATDVDSETVAHLVEDELRSGASLSAAVRAAAGQLVGSWALAVLRRGERAVVVTAHHSPLAVAHCRDGAFAASDMSALVQWAESVHFLEDGDLAELRTDGITWQRRDGSVGPPAPVATPWRPVDAEVGDAPDHMAKEIAEQASSAAAIVERLADGIADGSLWRGLDLPALHRVRFVACGTSLNAAAVLGRLLARCGQVPATLGPASELTDVVCEPGTLTLALSQSGETADVLRALDRTDAAAVLALTNSPYSTLARAADAVLELGIGPEIGVAATKTFTAQVVAGAAVLLSGLVDAGRLRPAAAALLTAALTRVPVQLAHAHRSASTRVPAVAAELTGAAGFVYIGRGAAVPYAAEGALKLKEISYRWAECQPAGELKHGPIALLEAGVPAVVVDDGHPKLAASIAEIATRGARVVTVGGPRSTLPYRPGPAADLPWGPLAAGVVLQHLAREIAVALGRDVDKPRNLAKSVTVE